jgi:serine/threonine protein kinase
MTTHPPTISKPAVAASGTDHDALPPGTRFGEFEILRVLGVGGFGIVYLAQDHSLEREVALKEYMPASLAARGAGPQITIRSSAFAETYAIGLRSFINEARLLARFDHPSLVKVYRFWEDNATAYMVMPFLQGTTLRDTRRGMPHPPDEAWIKSVITPILSALELLHREGVYHRDIAPDNILLPRDGPPVLLDFGAARRVISDRTQSLTAILKPSYAPIEQYAEMTQLRQGPWTDLYALGAVIHYLVFGVPPAPATARAVAEDGDAIENRVVPGISPRFLEAMSWMLAVRPNQRPQSGEQLRAVLDGHAQIPPRTPPGTTIPGALAHVAAGAQIEQAADATRINTAYLPTHMPAARAAPGANPNPTTFSPTTSMPTARATPVPGAGVTARQGEQPPAAPAATAPVPPAQRTAPTGASTKPGTAAGPAPAPSVAAAAPAAARSRPPSVPGAPATPSVQKPPQGSAAPSKPAPFAESRPATLAPGGGPHSRPAEAIAAASRPVPLGAGADAQPKAASRRTAPWVVLAAGGVVLAVAAAAALQFSTKRDQATAGAPGAASAVPSSVAAPARPPAPAQSEVIIETSDGTPSAVLSPSTGDVAKAPAPAPTPVPEAAGPVRPNATDRAMTGDSGAPAASSPYTRPTGKPVPPKGIDDSTTPAAPNSGTTSRGVDPYGPTTMPPPTYERPRSPATPPPATPRQVPAEGEPPTAAEACRNLGFFARNVCLDERCEEPRFKNLGDCPLILQRKHQRQNQ